MFALEGPVDSLIVAASNAGRTADSRWGCAAATATCNPIAATTIFATLVMSAEIIRVVLPVHYRFTVGSQAEPHSLPSLAKRSLRSRLRMAGRVLRQITAHPLLG